MQPLHARLGGATQHVYDSEAEVQEGNAEGLEGGSELEVAGPTLRRRVILTDALGEASFSMPGVRYVIDTGLLLKTVSPLTA